MKKAMLTIYLVGLFVSVQGCKDYKDFVNELAADDMQQIEQQVAQDMVKEYYIAKNYGSALDAYTAASLVVAAYLQANDISNYRKWKEIEQQEKIRYEREFEQEWQNKINNY